MGSSDWYHNLASPSSVKENFWTLIPSTKWCVVIQSLAQSRWASAYSSGFPENSGLKWDQFRCTTWCAGCTGCCGACGSGGSAWSGGGLGVATFCGCSPGSALPQLFWTYFSHFIYYSITLYSYPILYSSVYYCFWFILSPWTCVNSICIVKISSLILERFTSSFILIQFSLKHSLFLVLLGISSFSFEIPDETPCYVRQWSLSYALLLKLSEDWHHVYYLLCALHYTTAHLWVPFLCNT